MSLLSYSTLDSAKRRLAALYDGARPTRDEAKAVRTLAEPPKRKAVKPMRAAAFPKSSAHAELMRDWDNAIAEERWRTIKAEVAKRSGGRCELPGCTLPAVDPHHIISGPLKRKHEAVNTVVALCRPDHDRAQSNAWPVLVALCEWAEERGYRKAASELERRIRRIEECEAAGKRFAARRSGAEGDGNR